MKLALVLAAMLLPTAVTAGNRPGEVTMAGVERPDRARTNYILKCQGCHGPAAQGDRSTTPPMAGMVARFLAVPGGRAFLGRVPGVATAAVTDAELAELLNWTLQRFDAAHVPAGFVPYTTAEIATLRKSPLRTETAAMRHALVGAMKTTKAAEN